MAIRGLTAEEIQQLVGSRHEAVGFEYPPNGLQPYYQWLVSTLHLLGQASAGGLRVEQDDATQTTVRVAAGRASLDAVTLEWTGGAIDLGVYNNDTVYVWLYDDSSGGGGMAAIGVGADATGWPSGSHIKLAEVTLAAGQITEIVDRRFETMLKGGLDTGSAAGLLRYGISITTQGDVSNPSTVTIQLQDFHGNAIQQVNYLRVRVCNNGGYVAATNATIAPTPGPGSNTTTVETLTANKDLIVQSHTDGVFKVDLTDATVETVTLRIGQAVLSGLRGDYTATVNVTHA